MADIMFGHAAVPNPFTSEKLEAVASRLAGPS